LAAARQKTTEVALSFEPLPKVSTVVVSLMLYDTEVSVPGTASHRALRALLAALGEALAGGGGVGRPVRVGALHTEAGALVGQVDRGLLHRAGDGEAVLGAVDLGEHDEVRGGIGAVALLDPVGLARGGVHGARPDGGRSDAGGAAQHVGQAEPDQNGDDDRYGAERDLLERAAGADIRACFVDGHAIPPDSNIRDGGHDPPAPDHRRPGAGVTRSASAQRAEGHTGTTF
jgi:hypothetical protein